MRLATMSQSEIESTDFTIHAKDLEQYIGQRIFLWYEDQRSVAEKVVLAKLFGVTGVSLWRLGIIPHYSNPQFHYDVMSAISPQT